MTSEYEKSQDEEELELETDDTQDEEVLVTYDIATYPSDFTLLGIYTMWEENDITIPEFQREFVWSIRQSSLLIESFLLGLPVPPVFFYIDDQNKNLVIDGQQRILSIVFFIEGYFGAENPQGKRQVFRLQGLDEKSPYYKKKFEELSESSQRKLKTSVLRAINIRQIEPKGENTSVFHIFERLNTGGTPLKPQEIRNVVFRGKIVEILRELNQNENWRMVLGKSIIDKHQKDVELVLRIFALCEKLDEYEKPMKEFLNKTMQENTEGDSPRVTKFIENFHETSALIVEKLGEKPFHVRGPLNTSVLDSVFCILMESLDQITSDLKKRYNNLCLDPDFVVLTTTGTTDPNVVKDRFKLVRSYLID